MCGKTVELNMSGAHLNVWIIDFRFNEGGIQQGLLDSVSSPSPSLGRDDCGFLNLTNGSEFFLNGVVGNQYADGLAAIV